VNENFLSFVWQYRLYNTNLITTSGIPVTVIKPGEQHNNAGPDFFNARIRIGDTLWAGNVEIHVKASDWYRHGHQTDKAYNNVILHVVYEADSDIITGDMTTIPTIALSNQMNDDVLRKYSNLRASRLHIPCGKHLMSLNNLTILNWIDRMLVERLEHKSIQIEQTLYVNKNNWEDAFYQLLARNFGFNINAGPFEMLARCMPRNLILKHVDQLHQVEALLMGQAGFLEDKFEDNYPLLLQKEYKFLAGKYGLLPLDKHLWKLLRMRPANFPTIRLSQFAALISSGHISFRQLLEMENPQNLIKQFRPEASPYWNNHYLFDKPTRYDSRVLGLSSARNIFINTIAPLLFYYGKTRGEVAVCDKAFDLLRGLPAEENHILDEWKKLNVKAENAYSGQALLGLYTNFCSQKKCLNCSLGKAILKPNE
jgi:hypothetical protein